MSLWNDITEKVGAGSRVVADKAKEVSEIANIRAQIVSCDNTLVKNFKELGKAYFEAHKDDIDGDFSDIMNVIKEATAKKAGLNDQLAERKAAKSAAGTAEEVVNDVAEAAADTVSDVVDTVGEVAKDITE